MSIKALERQAKIAEASIIVRARFIEAVDTIEAMDLRNYRPSVVRSFWPAVSDRVDGEFRSRFRPTNAAISRAEEALTAWLFDFVPADGDRLILVRWSGSIAAPRRLGSFGKFCEKNAINRRTAERAVVRTVHGIADELLKTLKTLHEPDWSRVSQLAPKSRKDFGMVAERVAQQNGSFWRADDAKPSHRPEML